MLGILIAGLLFGFAVFVFVVAGSLGYGAARKTLAWASKVDLAGYVWSFAVIGAVLALIAFASGCFGPHETRFPGVYAVSVADWFPMGFDEPTNPDTSKVMARAVRKAEDFCNEKGKTANIITSTTHLTNPEGEVKPSAGVTFRCVPRSPQ